VRRRIAMRELGQGYPLETLGATLDE